MAKRTLKDEFQWYKEHHKELLKQYEGRFLVIKEGKVIGDFDTDIDAVKESSKKHELGTFLVQHCIADIASQTQRFHTRVAFA